MNENGRQEHHGGVQVEHGGDDHYQQQACGEQHDRRSGETLHETSGLLK